MPLTTRAICARVFRLPLLLAAAATLIWGQSDTGSLAGRVTDPSGGAVSGAKVTLTNDATGVALPSTTNPEGLYEYPSAPVGTYTIQVEQPGFKRLRQGNLTVAIARRLSLDLA